MNTYQVFCVLLVSKRKTGHRQHKLRYEHRHELRYRHEVDGLGPMPDAIAICKQDLLVHACSGSYTLLLFSLVVILSGKRSSISN